MSQAQQLLDAVRERTAGTPYVVTETPTGFDVRVDIENASWYALMYKQHLDRTWIYHVSLDEAAKTMSITDDVRGIDWRAGARSEGGVPVPVLSAAASGARGRFESKSFQKTFAFNEQGEFGKVVDFRFDSSEGRDLIRGPARDLGWSEKMGGAQRTGLVFAVAGGVLAVVVVVALVVLAVAGVL